MVMEFYDSQYLLILAPSLVIALMFLFFWLFMKETSYDEVLARQKRDLRFPSSKPDARKKGDKKRSKKKEGGGGAGGGGGESEEDPRELDLTDAVVSPPPEEEEPARVVPTPIPVEPPSSLRERKKKEKKQQQVAVTVRAVSPPPVSEEQTPTREVNGSKPTSRKTEPALGVTKQPSPPPAEHAGKKKGSQRKQRSEADELHLEVKVEQASAPIKREVPVSAETRVQDGAPPNASAGPSSPGPTATITTTTSSTATTATTTGGGKKKNSAKKQKTEAVTAPLDEAYVALDTDTATHGNPQKGHLEEVTPKVSGKKLKSEANKENSEVRLREFLTGLRSLVLSEEDAMSVAVVLREKNPSALDAWHRSTAKPELSAQKLQEKERMLTTLQEESSIAKEKVKQLSQELQAEKQKTAHMEALVREQRGAMEEQQNAIQANYQMKYQQVREQLDGQIARLQQENNILRDAVSTGESKQSSELNQLRGECARLMKELSEATGKHQQEERQRKSLEVGYKQNISQLEAQLQDAKRRWEELQGFLHSVNAEREKLQANKQELQNQLLAAESEMGNKNKEIQTLRSSLTDVMVSKEQVEQRLVQLHAQSQHAQPDTSLQEQMQTLLAEKKALQLQIENLQNQLSAQTTTAHHFDELQKLLADKELQRKSLEDTLNGERSIAASRETEMQAMRSEILTLKANVQDLQDQLSEQASSQLVLDNYKKSIQEKDDKIKTVEQLLETGLIEVANKEENLKKLKEKNEALKRDLEALQQQQQDQVPAESLLEELQQAVQEKDKGVKMLEEKLQAEMENMLNKERLIQVLEQQVKTLTAEVAHTRQREAEEAEVSAMRLRELQSLLSDKDEEMQAMQRASVAAARETVAKEQQIQVLQEECVALKGKIDEQQVVQAEVPNQDLLAALAEKEGQVSELTREAEELRASLELQRKKNDELREKNWSAMEALSATESMLQGKLCKTVQDSRKAVETAEADCRDILHSVLPDVPLPTNRNHQEWLRRFEAAAKEALAAEPAPASQEDTKMLEGKLKESEEARKILLKDCEMYKKVLAETEGILQRLQSSVEQEESRWKVKLEVSQIELKEMNLRVVALENEVGRLTLECTDVENMRHEKQQIELELERAERESASYVTEVRELKDLLTELQSKLDGSYTEAVRQNEELTLLKTQLTQTLVKLQTEESERQKVAGDLYKAQQSLELIQAEILKETGQVDLIENSTIETQKDEMDRKEKMAAGLNETVVELQQLLRAVNRQLTKGTEVDVEKETPEL